MFHFITRRPRCVVLSSRGTSILLGAIRADRCIESFQSRPLALQSPQSPQSAACASESGVICISRNGRRGGRAARAPRTCERTGAHTLLVVAPRKKIAAISGLLCCCSAGTMASRWRIFVEITVESTRLCEKCRSSPYRRAAPAVPAALLAPLQSK